VQTSSRADVHLQLGPDLRGLSRVMGNRYTSRGLTATVCGIGDRAPGGVPQQRTAAPDTAPCGDRRGIDLDENLSRTDQNLTTGWRVLYCHRYQTSQDDTSPSGPCGRSTPPAQRCRREEHSRPPPLDLFDPKTMVSVTGYVQA